MNVKDLMKCEKEFQNFDEDLVNYVLLCGGINKDVLRELDKNAQEKLKFGLLSNVFMEMNNSQIH